MSVPSSKAGCRHLHPAFEDGTDTGFRNVGQLQFDAGEIPKRIYTIVIIIIIIIIIIIELPLKKPLFTLYRLFKLNPKP